MRPLTPTRTGVAALAEDRRPDRPVHRPDAQPAPVRAPRRLALEGAAAGRVDARRGHALGHPAIPRRRSATASCSSRGTATRSIYAMLAVYNEALRAALRGDRRRALPACPHAEERALYWEDLLTLRHNGACPATRRWRARRSSSSSTPVRPDTARRPRSAKRWRSSTPARARCKVFAMEGEGGHTAGAHHEVKNSAWGLGLDNLIYLFDWNDHGIDCRRAQRGRARHAERLVRALRLARRGHRERRGLRRDHEGAARRSCTPTRPSGRPGHGVGQDAQGPRLPQVRLRRATARRTRATRSCSGSAATTSRRSTASSGPARRHEGPRRGRVPRRRRASGCSR